MSAQTKDKIIATVMFIIIFIMWLYFNISNHKLHYSNSKNIERIANILEISDAEVEFLYR